MTGQPPPQPLAPGWGQDLYTGAAGIALAHIEHAHRATVSWRSAHDWISTMVRTPITAHPYASGLDHGAPAVAFTLHSADQSRYAHPLALLDTHITATTQQRLHRAHHRIDTGRLPALREYDLIRGLTGIGAYLLHRHRGGRLLHDVLAYLVRLTHPRTIDGHRLPGWWSGNAPNDQPSPHWPGGHANLGMAHGIAGPLALLSLATLHGITVTGQAEAIDRICGWLDKQQVGANTRAWWPETISRAEHQAGTVRQPGPGRPSWCYGTPGLARAQQLAGLALPDPQRRHHAEQALAGCLADDDQLAQLTDASLCHGWAGLLHTTWRVACDAEHPQRLRLPLHRHADRLTQCNDPAARPGLLDGAAGVSLARYTVTTGSAPRSGWDTCLLLAADAPQPRRAANTEVNTARHQQPRDGTEGTA